MSKFIVELKGSVSQRNFRYDTAAAAESTHQSRSDYQRRKAEVLAEPAWMQHATSDVTDLDAAKNPGAQQQKRSATVLYRPTQATNTKQQQLQLQQQQKEKSQPAAALSAESGNAPPHQSPSPASGKIVVWTHKGVEQLPEEEVATHVSASTKRRYGGSDYDDKSSVSCATNSSIRSVIGRRKEMPMGQPMAFGDILGKSKNITRAQELQRQRYEALEARRLAQMRERLDEKGWAQETSPGGPDKRVSRRIYAGLPVEMDAEAEKYYKDLAKTRAIPFPQQR